jgi:hypothetical protein
MSVKKPAKFNKSTMVPSNGTKWRNTADGVLWAVDKGGPIQPETLEHLLALLREKTDYPHHVAVEVTQGALLRTIDNENDAQETIRRLDAAPRKAEVVKTLHCSACLAAVRRDWTRCPTCGVSPLFFNHTSRRSSERA